MSFLSKGKHDRRHALATDGRPPLRPEHTMPIPALVLPAEAAALAARAPLFRTPARPRHAKPPVPMNREPVPAVRPYVTGAARHLDVLTAPMEQLVAAGLADDPRPAARPAKVFLRDYRMPAFRAAVRARGFLALHTRRFGGTA